MCKYQRVVTLGGRLAAAALALMMTSSMTVPVFAEEMQDADALNAVVYTDEAYYGASSIESTITKVGWETGLAAFSKYVPFASLFMPTVKALGELIGITGSSSSSSKEPTISDVQKDIEKTRKELIDHMNKLSKDIENKMDDNTRKTLNEIQFTGFSTGVYAEFDGLQGQLNELSNQIHDINTDPDPETEPGKVKLNEQEKAVQIAALLGHNAEWINKSSIMQQFDRIGNYCLVSLIAVIRMFISAFMIMPLRKSCFPAKRMT